MTARAAGAPDRLARQRLDAGVRQARRAPERALHHAGRAVPVDRARMGGPRGRADRRDPLRRPPLDRGPARARGLRLEARRVPRRDDVLRDDGRGGRRRSASCASTRWRCCRSAATTWPTTSGHWLEDRPSARREAAADLLRQLVPQGRERPVPVAGLRREQPRARVDLPPLRRRGRGGRDADRPRAAPGALDTDGLDITEERARRAPAGRRRGAEARAPRPSAAPRTLRRRVPEPLRDELSGSSSASTSRLRAASRASRPSQAAPCRHPPGCPGA